MIGIQALLAAVTRSLGKLLNTAFGWATILLFGKVAQDRQIYLSVITLGSVIWLVALLGVAFPAVGTFLLTFVKLPKWVDHGWVRLAMLAAVAVLPVAVGVASLLMLTPEQRPRDSIGRVKVVLRGFPYTVGLSLTLAMRVVFAPMLKVRNILRRWTDRHVPVIVESRDYDNVVKDVQAALKAGGISTIQARASWMLRVPTSVLTWFARDQTQALAPDRLTKLVPADMGVLLHPADLVISGRERDIAHAQSVISEYLTFTDAYLTWQKESNEIEDRLREIWEERHQPDIPVNRLWERLRRVERKLRSLKLPYEEWEVLFRELTVIKLRLLEAHAPPDIATWQPRLSPSTVTDWLPLLGAGVTFLARVRSERSGRGEAQADEDEEGEHRVPRGMAHEAVHAS